MTEVFVFDAKCLNDEQLFTQQVELSRRRIQAARIGQIDAANQIEILIQAIEYERRERMFLDRVKQLPTSPILIETDPDMRAQEIVDAETNTPKPAQPQRPVRRAIRTATPVLPTGDSDV